eukprot:162187_1
MRVAAHKLPIYFRKFANRSTCSPAIKRGRSKFSWRSKFSLAALASAVTIAMLLFNSRELFKYKPISVHSVREAKEEFAWYDGGELPIPNIAHWVWLYDHNVRPDLRFFEYLSLKSIRRYANPDILRVLVNDPEVLTGEWWTRAKRELNLTFTRPLFDTNKIGGRDPEFATDKTDLLRLWSLRVYGGMYFDSDIWLVNSPLPLRQYQMVLGAEDVDVSSFCNAVLMAAPGSVFLQRMMLSWTENYHPNMHFFNAIREPSRMALEHLDEVHIEPNSMFRPSWFEFDQIFKQSIDLSQKYTLHLWHSISGDYIPNDFSPLHLENDKNTTFLNAARMIYYD